MQTKLKSVLLGGVALLFGYAVFKGSLYLAAMRIYQVDECQNVFVARILALGKVKEAYTNLSLFQLPFSWLARGATDSADLFASARFLAVVLFWLNLLLLALATGERVHSRRILIALVGAATLAPLWDYGFEIRHDNLLLTGLLLFWCAVRNTPATRWSFGFAGAVAVALQFVAFKALVYTLPLSVLILFFPRIHSTGRWKLALAWAAGAIGTLLLFRLAYGAAGLWDLFVSDTRRVFADATGNNRFPAWATLSRLLTQAPLLVAMILAGLVAAALDVRQRGRAALAWNGWAPEGCFLAVVFAALMLNPAPYAYNLLHLVPFAFLFAYRYAMLFLPALWETASLRPFVISVVLLAHLVPFGIATRRHLNFSNFRQVSLMELAESLTAPGKDRVYDGSGLVPTRDSSHFQWLLHSLNIENFRKPGGTHVREMLAERPASVVIPNYRTDWLPEADQEFIRDYYVPLADDFWVLGKMLPPGGGAFEILQPGRYQITAQADSCISGTGDTNRFTLLGLIQNAAKARVAGGVDSPAKTNLIGTLDGAPLLGPAVELTIGRHQIETAQATQPAVVWLGPKLKRLQPIPDRDHRLLFVNWY